MTLETAPETLLIAPKVLRAQFPLSAAAANVQQKHVANIRNVLARKDDRILLIVGPCSLHDRASALEYAERLHALATRVEEKFIVIMRTYFEKPRTTVGWKGWINDVNLDGESDINAGYQRARELLRDICELGLPTATEVMHPVTVSYLHDLLSWACIGARTVESQLHPEFASDMPIPVGFKNSTNGTITTAINAIQAARQSQTYIGNNDDAQLCQRQTSGNLDTHLILRGGVTGPNYHVDAVNLAVEQLRSRGLTPNVMIDCSHDNSEKQPSKVPDVFNGVIEQIARGNNNIVGIMLESHLVEGRQDITTSSAQLTYGQSITDPCINWGTTEELIMDAYNCLQIQ